MLKATTSFAMLFQRNKSAVLDVTDDSAERPWDEAYANVLFNYLYNYLLLQEAQFL